MFSSRKSKNLIYKIHDGSLRIISDDKESDLQTLLENPNQLTIHQRNLQVLMIEVWKTSYYNIRKFQIISNKKIKWGIV